ncbi:mcfS, partial [Acrasis kona]
QSHTVCNLRRLQIFPEFISGSAGGLAGICVGYPLDTIKTRMQVFQQDHQKFNKTFTSPWAYARGLYKGLSSPLMGELVSNFVLFGTFGACKNFMNKYNETNAGVNYSVAKETGAIAVAGACAGLAISLVVAPTEMCKIQMQTASGNESQARKQSLKECVKHLWRTKGFFHGYASCLTHQLTFYSAYFLVYEMAKKRFAQYNKDAGKPYEQDAFSLLTSGGLAGMFAWALVYPTDTMQSIVRHDRDLNMRKAFKMYKARDFYRGFVPTVIRSFPVNAVTFYAYELAFTLCKNSHVWDI